MLNIKCITLYQPWATLIKDGKKTVETRSWLTKHRGKLAIHAGSTVDNEACIRFGYDPKKITRGAIICIVDLIDCVQFPNKIVKIDDYGDFTAGRYGWILKNVKIIEPVVIKGSMGLWNWNDENGKKFF